MNEQKFLEIDLLDLDVVSKIVGEYLTIESLIQEVVLFLKKRIPARKTTLFLCDEKRRVFYCPKGSGRRKSMLSPDKKKIFHRALESNEPVFSETSIFVPLRAKDKMIGVVLFESLTFTPDPLKYKETILYLTRLAGIVLANAIFFIEYESLNKDLFKMGVLNRALIPALNEETAVRILEEGINRIIRFDICALLSMGKEKHHLYIRSKIPLSRTVLLEVKKNIRELISNITHQPISMEAVEDCIESPKGKAASGRIQAYLNTPLIVRDRVIGVVSLSTFDKNGFSARDHRNISMLSSQGTVVLENTILYRDLQRTYFSIVKALTSAIEAKDPYTRGHSVLVSKYAEEIAAAMELSHTMVESIQIAGLLHDLGKIGVPEEILLKMGKLTFGEFEVVKEHPEIALKILGAVEFPHFYKDAESHEAPPELTLKLFEPADLSEDVKLMIYHHHERFGGGGYPKGLKGADIPLGARILAVADTFEAVTANRPYRKAFTQNEARDILLKAGGPQLDPVIVKVFLKVLKEKGLQELKAEAGF